MTQEIVINNDGKYFIRGERCFRTSLANETAFQRPNTSLGIIPSSLARNNLIYNITYLNVMLLLRAVATREREPFTNVRRAMDTRRGHVSLGQKIIPLPERLKKNRFDDKNNTRE